MPFVHFGLLQLSGGRRHELLIAADIVHHLQRRSFLRDHGLHELHLLPHGAGAGRGGAEFLCRVRGGHRFGWHGLVRLRFVCFRDLHTYIGGFRLQRVPLGILQRSLRDGLLSLRCRRLHLVHGESSVLSLRRRPLRCFVGGYELRILSAWVVQQRGRDRVRRVRQQDLRPYHWAIQLHRMFAGLF